MENSCPKCDGKGWYFVDEWVGTLQGRKDCTNCKISVENLFKNASMKECERMKSIYEKQLKDAFHKMPWMVEPWTRGLVMVNERIQEINNQVRDERTNEQND